MIRHPGQGPDGTPADADAAPRLPLDGADARDPGTEPTVPLETAEASRAAREDAASSRVAREPAPPPPCQPQPAGYIGHEREHKGMDLARLAWLGTVAVCLIAVAILVLEGYYGYAAVTFAVAASAALNLT